MNSENHVAPQASPGCSDAYPCIVLEACLSEIYPPSSHPVATMSAEQYTVHMMDPVYPQTAQASYAAAAMHGMDTKHIKQALQN